MSNKTLAAVIRTIKAELPAPFKVTFDPVFWDCENKPLDALGVNFCGLADIFNGGKYHCCINVGRDCNGMVYTVQEGGGCDRDGVPQPLKVYGDYKNLKSAIHRAIFKGKPQDIIAA